MALFIILGSITLVWTVFQFVKTASFQSSEMETVGTILSVETRAEGARIKTLLSIPTITFTADNGKVFTFVSDIKFNPGSIRSNDKILVGYDKNNPEIAHVYQPNNWVLWSYVILDLVASLLFFFFGWVIHKAAKRIR